MRLYLLCLALVFSACHSSRKTFVHQSDNLKIDRINARAYQHISYLQTNDFGKVDCNGLVVASDGEAIVLDTPVGNEDADELIDWVETKLKCKVVGVVATHFHLDCLGSLEAFHRRKIPSYANSATIELAKKQGYTLPQTGFDSRIELKVGNEKVVCEFVGEGHTKDNIVAYFPAEQVMFGGCLIKTLGANKGYIGDANLDAWSPTVTKVKKQYPNVQVVIPGHGKRGGQELLDYTIQLFQKE